MANGVGEVVLPTKNTRQLIVKVVLKANDFSQSEVNILLFIALMFKYKFADKIKI